MARAPDKPVVHAKGEAHRRVGSQWRLWGSTCRRFNPVTIYLAFAPILKAGPTVQATGV